MDEKKQTPPKLKRWFLNCKEADKQAREMEALVDHYDSHLKQFPTSAMKDGPLTHKQMVQLWRVHREEWNVAPGGMSLVDFLFVARCKALVASNPEQYYRFFYDTVVPDVREKGNLQWLFNVIRVLARVWKTSPEVSENDVQRLFSVCALHVQYRLDPEGMDKAIDVMYDTYEAEPEVKDVKALADDDVDPEEEMIHFPDSETDTTREQYLANEKRIMREMAIDNLVKGFIPWCARVFFPIWSDLELWNTQSKNLVQLDSKDPTSVAVRKIATALNVWVVEQCTYEPTELFTQEMQELCYRWYTPLGAVEFARRAPGAAQHVQTHRMHFAQDMARVEQVAIKDSLDMPVKDMARRGFPEVKMDDAKEAKALIGHNNDNSDSAYKARDPLTLHMFAFLLKTTFPKMDDFTQYYCALPDEMQLKWKRDLVFNTPTRAGRPRRPIVVLFRGRTLVHHGSRLFQHESLAHAIAHWMWIVRTEFKGVMEEGHEVDAKWVSDLLNAAT